MDPVTEHSIPGLERLSVKREAVNLVPACTFITLFFCLYISGEKTLIIEEVLRNLLDKLASQMWAK